MPFVAIPNYPQPGYWSDPWLQFQDGWARKASSLQEGKQAKPIPGLVSAVLPPRHWLFSTIHDYVMRSLEARSMSAPAGEETRMAHARKRLTEAVAEMKKCEDQIEACKAQIQAAKEKYEYNRNGLHMAQREGAPAGPGWLRDDKEAIKGMKKDLEQNKKLLEKQWKIVAAAKRRLMESGPGSGVKPPGSRAISIRNIRLLKHVTNWNRYSHLRASMSAYLAHKHDAYRKLERIEWTAPPVASPIELERAPLLNRDLGEALLFSGTARDTIQKFIVAQGFNPLFPKPRNPDAVKRGQTADYGMLGQGSYFTDSFALAMCYSTCRICGDFECECRTVDDRKTVRTVAVARCLLGNPRVYSSFKRKQFVDPFKQLTGQVDRTAAEKFRSWEAWRDPTDFAGFLASQSHHSAFAQGMNGTDVLFRAGTTCNQFMIRHEAQAYLEFAVDFVIGRDSSSFSMHLRKGLESYAKIPSQKSLTSLAAHAVLTALVNDHDRVTTYYPVSGAQLKQAVRFYRLGTNPPDGVGIQPAAWERLTPGRFRDLLSSLPDLT
jgi:hypothetical protein